MTFNLRFENDFDGDNRWGRRCELLVRTILKYGPHIVGTQEGKPSQLDFLSERLTGYRISADFRWWDRECQYPTLFCLEQSFRFLEGGEFWLSETPAVHRSKSWNSAFPRMMSYAHLEVRKTGQRLWSAVTHLDHISERARIEGAKMIRTWAFARRAPVVLVGDFNDGPGSEVHQVLTFPHGPFLDTWETLGRREDKGSYTQHGFSGVGAKGRIDWVLVTPEFKVLKGIIGRDHEEGRYPSDHFPYWVDVRLEDSPRRTPGMAGTMREGVGSGSEI
jgi:endonuclease/exonuclease/phosphatase family metal-dependent hydrolase